MPNNLDRCPRYSVIQNRQHKKDRNPGRGCITTLTCRFCLMESCEISVFYLHECFIVFVKQLQQGTIFRQKCYILRGQFLQNIKLKLKWAFRDSSIIFLWHQLVDVHVKSLNDKFLAYSDFAFASCGQMLHSLLLKKISDLIISHKIGNSAKINKSLQFRFIHCCL